MSVGPFTAEAGDVALALDTDREDGLGAATARTRLADAGADELPAEQPRALVAAVASTVALQVVLVTVTPARDLLGLVSLAPAEWLLVTAVAVTFLLVVEGEKLVRRRRWTAVARTWTAVART